MIRDTVCRLCSSCCPIEAEVRDKRLVRAWRKSFLDPDKRLPCAKLAAAPEIVYSPLRLTRPLIRDDRKADFREAGWDEALDRVAGLMRHHRERSGARSVAWLRGMAADWGAPWDYPNRLMHGFGSPNTIGNGSICFVGREFAHTYTYGSMAFPEAKNAKLHHRLGQERRQHRPGRGRGDPLGQGARRPAGGHRPGAHRARRQGRPVAADPARPRRPAGHGHDPRDHQQDLFDADFVANHTVGFDALKEVAARYPAERVAAELWLEPEQIRDLARSYATVTPASIIDGNGLDMHREMFDTTRAIAMLRALTGNLDKPGGDVLPQPVPVRNIQLRERLPADAEPITRDFPLFNTFSETWGNQMQGALVDAMLDGHPYPVEMVIVQSGNPVVTMADTTRTRRAFGAVEHLVVIDLFMNETARMADIVLPATSCFEKTQLNRASIRNNPMFLQNAVIEPVGESWPDWRIVFELGRRLGLEAEFPWHTAEAAIDFQLEPAGVTVADLRANGKGLRLEEIALREVPRPAPAHALGQGGVFLGAAGCGRF